MKRNPSTQEKLLHQARRLMWARGYSSVSVRQIASAAGVDVALISRYFKGKHGLFVATLDQAFSEPALIAETKDQLVEQIVYAFINAPRNSENPSVIQMLLMNAHDEEVGPFVREQCNANLQAGLELIIGNKAQAALFMAVLLGISVAEKTLHLDGIADASSQQYEAQLRHMMAAALEYQY